jgi:phage tail-like protein
MDANQTRYQLLLGNDWTLCAADPDTLGGGAAELDPVTAEFRLHKQVFQFPPPAGDRMPSLEDRRGAGVDRFGNWYSIDDASTSIQVNSAGSGVTTLYWRPGYGAEPILPIQRLGAFEPSPAEVPQSQVMTLGGLAVTVDHYLVVGLVDPKGLLIFDLRTTGGPPRRTAWPATVDFTPWDMAPRIGGGVWILDRDHTRLWELNREFLVVSRRSAIPASPGSFAPADGTEPIPAAPAPRYGSIDLEDALLLPGAPVSVESAPDGSILILDRRDDTPPSVVRRYVGGTEEQSFPLADLSVGVSFVAHDIALVPAAAPRGGALGALYAVDSTGDQSYRFDLALDDTGGLEARLVTEYYPMRVFGGKALVADSTQAYYDFSDRFIPLVVQSRPRFDVSATVLTPVLDGHAPGNVWHRVLMDGSIPPGTTVTVWSRATDEEGELAVVGWNLEPTPYRRASGSELPYLPSPEDDRHRTWELLLQRSRGQFLQLKLQLAGDGRTTPRLSALRAYYPRFSYLERYLPRVYRNDPISASFLDRFLANPEGMSTALEDRIAAAQVLFDARSAPAETLDWLASWFDFALDPNWPVARRRLFIKHAMDFFAVRGTTRGLEMTLRLALDPPTCADERLFDVEETPSTSAARIVERFRTRQTPAVVLGDPTESTGLRVVAPGGRWLPAQGRDALDSQWRAYVGVEDTSVELPLQPPGDNAAVWNAFVLATLGFVPTSSPDLTLWTAFLARRYGTIAALDAAYGVTGSARHTSFGDVEYPTAVPTDGAALRDWFQFEAVVLPMRRNASRFTVLLPVPTTDDPNAPTNDQRRAIAQRVLDLHKPAHTTYDIRFFWSAFRVGEARLGEDTLIDLGSRSPLLLQPAVLGSRYVGESTLGGDPPPILTDPPSVGRNPVQR